MNYQKMKITEQEIRKLYKDFCIKNNVEFDEGEFQEFQYYLDIDFRKWVISSMERYHSESLATHN